jgi:hypothetical protein
MINGETMDISGRLLEKAIQYLESAEAFVQGEVPLYLTELLRFKVVEHLVEYFDDMLCIGVIYTIAAILSSLLRKEYTKKTEKGVYKYDQEEREVSLSVQIIVHTMGIFLLTLSICKTNHLVQAYKAAYSPRVYLIDYVKDSIKGEHR